MSTTVTANEMRCVALNCMRSMIQSAQQARSHDRRAIGVELEFPVVDRDGRAAGSYRWLHRLKRSGWFLRNQERAASGVSVPYLTDGRSNMVTLDAGTCTIEVVSRPHDNLHDLQHNVHRILRDLICAAANDSLRLLGYGSQPRTPGGPQLWVARARYGALRTFFSDCDIADITITACAQAHVDVNTEDEAVKALVVGNALAPWIIGMFANNPVWKDRDTRTYAAREGMWDCFPRERIGILHCHQWPANLEDVLEYMLNRPLVCCEREGAFPISGVRFAEWIEASDHLKDDIVCHEGMLWPSARLRSDKATVELRPACAQPQDAQLALPALWLGLVENLERAYDISRPIGPGDATQFRQLAISNGPYWSGFRPMAWEIVRIAQEGLQRRKLGEEKYLCPLWQRLRAVCTPADHNLRVFQYHGLSSLLDRTVLRSNV